MISMLAEFDRQQRCREKRLISSAKIHRVSAKSYCDEIQCAAGLAETRRRDPFYPVTMPPGMEWNKHLTNFMISGDRPKFPTGTRVRVFKKGRQWRAVITDVSTIHHLHNKLFRQQFVCLAAMDSLNT